MHIFLSQQIFLSFRFCPTKQFINFTVLYFFFAGYSFHWCNVDVAYCYWKAAGMGLECKRFANAWRIWFLPPYPTFLPYFYIFNIISITFILFYFIYVIWWQKEILLLTVNVPFINKLAQLCMYPHFSLLIFNFILILFLYSSKIQVQSIKSFVTRVFRCLPVHWPWGPAGGQVGPHHCSLWVVLLARGRRAQQMQDDQSFAVSYLYFHLFIFYFFFFSLSRFSLFSLFFIFVLSWSFLLAFFLNIFITSNLICVWGYLLVWFLIVLGKSEIVCLSCIVAPSRQWKQKIFPSQIIILWLFLTLREPPQSCNSRKLLFILRSTLLFHFQWILTLL